MELKAAEIPPYLRFDVKLNYFDSRGGKIGERFEWVQMILQPFKQALTGSKFEFLGVLNHDDESDFKDSSTLIDQIDRLLQILTRCRAYKFYIDSQIYENTSTHILASILQFDAIVRCSKIRVEFDFWDRVQMHLPIEAIGNWLNRTNANGQKRFLKLNISDNVPVPDLGEMFGHLKKVCHSFL